MMHRVSQWVGVLGFWFMFMGCGLASPVMMMGGLFSMLVGHWGYVRTYPGETRDA